MWNYSHLFSSIPILIIFLIYFYMHPRLSIRINRVFVVLLYDHIATIVIGFFATKACEYYSELPRCIVFSLNLMFFMFFFARDFLFFQFTLFLLKPYIDVRRPFYKLTSSVFCIAEIVAISSIITGAVFYIDNTGYHSGPLYNILYICSFFYCGLSITLVLLNAGHMSRFDFFSIFSYNAILMIGYIVRLMLPKYLIMNSFCLMSIIIIYLSYENPDYYISGRGTAFNRRAFQLKIDEIRNKPYRILAFAVHDYAGKRGLYGGRQMDLAIHMINLYLTENFPDSTVFYLNNGYYALLCNMEADCELIGQEIRNRFKKPWKSGSSEVNLNVSFIQTIKEKESDSADKIISTLIVALDMAGQRAISDDEKEMPENIQNIDQQIQVRRILESALDHNALEVFLQPIYDANTNNIIAAEALVRMRDYDGDLISPNMFIPIAEKNGYINRLGKQVFEKVCAFIHNYPLESLGLQWINVNLSPLQCMSKKLADDFDHILRKYSIQAEQIHLEITEQTMDDVSVLQNQIKELYKLGFQFALDDYGSGYSNLLRVKRYPFNNIKLDMEIVWDYARDRDYLVPGLVQTFKNMNLTITAEGVESEEMAQAMSEIGCDYLQGFYYSKPLSISEFVKKYKAA